jgi:nucleoside-diphosphate-sugar epimerase
MKRVLLTGAAGFVGANLARRLVGDGHEVHAAVRPGGDRWRLAAVRGELRFHDVDLAEEGAVREVVQVVRPEWIFHLAAHGGSSWQRDVRAMIHTNILGTVHLANACLAAGFDAFVNTGSSSEYGRKDHAPREDDALEPNSDYAVTKASATMFCRLMASRHARLTTLRLYSVYGPYEDPRRLLPTLIVCGREGRLPDLVDPAAAHDFVYVDDVVDAYVLAATVDTSEPGAIYNVGTGCQTTLEDVVALTRRIFSIDEPPRWGSMPRRPWDTTAWVANLERTTAALEWRPRHSLEAGFRRMVEWLCGDPALLAYYRDRSAAGPRRGLDPARLPLE